MKKKIFIKTFGCQMNEYDSNRILDAVKGIGFYKTENDEEANCYVLNTCHIRDKAKEKNWMLMTYYCPTHGDSGIVEPIEISKKEIRETFLKKGNNAKK